MEQFRPWRYRPVFPCAVYPVDRIARYTRSVTTFNMDAWTPALPLEGYDPLLWLRADQGISTGGGRRFYATNKTSLQHTDNAFFSTGDIDFLWAGWAMIDASTGANQVLGGRTGNSQAEYQVVYRDATTCFGLDLVDGGLATVGTVSSSAISLGKWYYVVAWHDATANTVNISVNNGTTVSSATTGVPSDTVSAFVLGINAYDNTQYLRGKLSRVSFFKNSAARAVIDSAATRTEMYNLGRGILSGNLDLLLADLGTFTAGTDWDSWNLNETDGTAAARSFSGLNDLTPTFGELISNGGFETAGGGGADVFGSWEEFISGTASISDETVIVNAGGHAGKLEVTAGGSLCNVKQSVLSVGHRYTIVLWAKRGTNGTAVVYCGDSYGNRAEFALTDTYAQYSVVKTCVVNGVFSIQCLANGHTIYVDTVSVKAYEIPACDGPNTDIAPDTGSVGTAHGQLIGYDDSETARSTDTADGSPNPTVEDRAGTYDGLMVGFAAPDTARSAHGLTGVPGKAITFDGSDDYVTNGSAIIDLATDWTMMGWIKPSSAGSTSDDCLGIGDGATTGALITARNGSTKIKILAAGTRFDGSTTVNVGTWYHVAIQKSGTTITLYLNGVSDGSATMATTDSASKLQIGRVLFDGTYYYRGTKSIADTRIYSTALTAPQIAAIAAGDSGATGSPVLRYDFDEADTRTLTTIGSGTSLVLDGVDDYVSCGSIGAVTAISLYVKLLIDNQEILTLTNSTTTAVTVAAGVLTFGASLTASAITVDGVSMSAEDAGATLNDNAWHLLAFSLTSISATGVTLGTDSSAYGQIMLDQVSVNAGTHIWTFDEQTSLSVTDGDPIAIAQSLEGSRYQLLNATASERPDYVASAINGNPGLEFDGVDDLLEYVGVPLTGTAGTVIAVCKVKAVPDAYQTLLASSDTATATKYMALHIRGNTANGHIGYGQNNAGTEDLLDGDTAVTDELDCAVYWASNGTTVTARLNGTAQTLTADTGANNGDWWDDSTGKDTTTIGALKHTSETNHAAIILCELIAYPINLSDASRATVAAYILREYGLTL